jgi:hypothetical protein
VGKKVSGLVDEEEAQLSGLSQKLDYIGIDKVLSAVSRLIVV